MTMMTLTQNEHPVSSGFRVDVSRGERIGRVSSEWFSRPDDERYLSLTDLNDAVCRRAERAMMEIWEKAIKPTLFDYGGEVLICSNSAGKNPDNFFYNISTDPSYGFGEYHPELNGGCSGVTRPE